MEKTIITIARQYGSGGRTVGKMLAKRMGIPFYDRQIIEMAAEDSGINAVLFHDEQKPHSLRSLLKGGYQGNRLLSPESAGFTKDDNLFNYQAKIIRQLADEGSCVLIGRCADYILRDEPNCLNLFLQAPKDVRIRRAVEEYGEDASKAADAVSKKDKQRGNYYNFYSNRKWGDMQNYDLILDTHTFGLQGTVDIILRALEEKEKTYGKPVPDADL